MRQTKANQRHRILLWMSRSCDEILGFCDVQQWHPDAWDDFWDDFLLNKHHQVSSQKWYFRCLYIYIIYIYIIYIIYIYMYTFVEALVLHRDGWVVEVHKNLSVSTLQMTLDDMPGALGNIGRKMSNSTKAGTKTSDVTVF